MLVQYVPLPVVGGYLGYVGYFCLAAGVSQACNVEASTLIRLLQYCPSRAVSHVLQDLTPTGASSTVMHFLNRGEPGLSSPMGCGIRIQGGRAQVDSFPSWANLGTRDALTKLGPALGSTLLLFATLKLGRNPLLLPAVLLAIPAAFHVALAATGTSLQQAADAGWTMQPEVGRWCSLVMSWGSSPATG